MPNALIVVGPSKNNMHITAAKLATEKLGAAGYEVKYVNTCATEDANVLKYHMQQANPDFLLTFDMAGFNLELMGGDLFYNSLCCPAVHVLFKPAEEYPAEFFKRMNFTMEFLTLGEADADYIRKKYFRVPKVSAIALPETAMAPDRLKRNLGIFLCGSYGQEKERDLIIEKIIGLFKANQIPCVLCGSGFKENFKEPNLILLGDDEPDYDSQAQIFSNSAIVIDIHRPGATSFDSILARNMGAGVIEITEWDEKWFLNKIIELSR